MRTQAQIIKDLEVYTIYKIRRNAQDKAITLGSIITQGTKKEVQTYYGITEWNYKQHGIKGFKKSVHSTYTSCVIKDSYKQ